MVCHLELLNCKLLYISKSINALGPICSPHSLLFPNTSSISTKKVESVLLSKSLSRSDSLITWQNTPPRQSEYSWSRSLSDTLDNWPGSPPRDNQFHVPRLSPRSSPSLPTCLTSSAPNGGYGAAAGSRPSSRAFKNSHCEQNRKRKTTMSDFIRLKREKNLPF